MSLKNILRTDLICCSPSTTISEVARLMKEKDVGAVLITSDGIPKGIITDRDLVLRCLADNAECKKTKVEDMMTKIVATVSEQDGIYNVAEKMKQAHVRRIPVTNSAGKAVGLLSFDDVFQLIGEEINNLKEAIQPTQPKIANQAA
jgi:CBS domain-containing protein